MLSPRYSALLGLGVALSCCQEKLQLNWLSRLGVVGCGWLLSGGWETVYIIIKTLPRDLKAVCKMIQLVVGTKLAEYRNLTVPKMFSETVSRCPDKVLFYYQDSEWTFQQVEDYSNRVARLFLQEGFSKGETVGVFMENRPEFVCTWLGLAKIGVVPALINYNQRAESLHHSISVAGARALVYSSALARPVADIFPLLINGTRLSFPTFVTGDRVSPGTLTVPDTRDLDLLCKEQSILPLPREVQDNINFTDKLLYIFTSGTTGNTTREAKEFFINHFLIRDAQSCSNQTREVHSGLERSDQHHRSEEE